MSGKAEEQNREKQVQDAANSLKRENTRSDTIESDDESEKKDKKDANKVTANRFINAILNVRKKSFSKIRRT